MYTFFYILFQELRHKPLTVQQLVDEFIGPYYANYSETRAVLVRQAKQLLTNVYQGDVVNFHGCFCVPVSEILKKVEETFRKYQVFMMSYSIIYYRLEIVYRNNICNIINIKFNAISKSQRLVYVLEIILKLQSFPEQIVVVKSCKMRLYKQYYKWLKLQLKHVFEFTMTVHVIIDKYLLPVVDL